jgi:hypothetical protein
MNLGKNEKIFFTLWTKRKGKEHMYKNTLSEKMYH